jgi:ABC-type nitrate/sulfonate/bicarbonate transport system substrate-binding protein
MRDRLLRIVVGFMILSLTPIGEAQAQKVVVGTGVDPSFSPLYVAHEAGLFSKHGVDVEIKRFASGSAAVPSLIPGDIHVAMTGPAAALLAHMKSPKVVMVAQFVTQTGYNELIGDKTIMSVPGLRGRRVGYELGSTMEVFAIEIFRQHNMTPKDVIHVNLQPPEALAALQRGNVDAVFVFKPWTDRAVEALKDKIHKIPGAEKFSNHLHVFMDREWAEKNMDPAVKFLAAIQEAGVFTNQNRGEAAVLVGKHLRMEGAAVRPLLDLNEFTLVMNQGTIELLKREVDLQARTGRLGGTFSYSSFVYPEPLRKLNPALVNYKLP